MEFLRYPAPDYVPLVLRGPMTVVAAGAEATIFTLSPKPGMKRLRLTHLFTYTENVTLITKHQISCTIPGLSDLKNIIPLTTLRCQSIPLFYTIDAQSSGEIRVINPEAVPITYHVTLFGFYDSKDVNYNLENSKWLKYLMPPVNALPFVERMNGTDVLFTCPNVGEMIRIHAMQGHFANNLSIEGEGLQHFQNLNDADVVVGRWAGDNENYIPVLGHMLPGKQYRFVNSQEMCIYGWAFKW